MEFAELPRRRSLLSRRFAEGEPTPAPPRRKLPPESVTSPAGPPVGERLADPPEAWTFGDLAEFVQAGVAAGWEPHTRVGVSVLEDEKQDGNLEFRTGTILGVFQRGQVAPVEVVDVVVDEAEVERGLREMRDRQAAMERKRPGPTRW